MSGYRADVVKEMPITCRAVGRARTARACDDAERRYREEKRRTEGKRKADDRVGSSWRCAKKTNGRRNVAVSKISRIKGTSDTFSRTLIKRVIMRARRISIID